MYELSIFTLTVLFFVTFIGYFIKRRMTASSTRKMLRRQKAIEKNFRSGRHIWKPFNKKGFYYCNLCEELMGGLFCNSMSECSKCGK